MYLHAYRPIKIHYWADKSSFQNEKATVKSTLYSGYVQDSAEIWTIATQMKWIMSCFYILENYSAVAPIRTALKFNLSRVENVVLKMTTR